MLPDSPVDGHLVEILSELVFRFSPFSRFSDSDMMTITVLESFSLSSGKMVGNIFSLDLWRITDIAFGNYHQQKQGHHHNGDQPAIRYHPTVADLRSC